MTGDIITSPRTTTHHPLGMVETRTRAVLPTPIMALDGTETRTQTLTIRTMLLRAGIAIRIRMVVPTIILGGLIQVTINQITLLRAGATTRTQMEI